MATTGGVISAAGNWWGAADGPAGVGPGSGDAVGLNVDYSGFQTVAPAGCPNRLSPIAGAGKPQTANPGATVTLDGSESADRVGDGLTFGWTQTGGTAVSFSPALSRTTFTAPGAAGILTFTLTVTDSHGLPSAPDEIVVTVASNN